MQALAFRSYPVQPWRNGRGILRSIAQGDGWQLRLADIEHTGPFSDYAGRLRLFAIVRGAVILRMPSGPAIACDPQSPIVTFDGGEPPDCELTPGDRESPARALNLIVEPRRVVARLDRHAIGGEPLVVTGEGGDVVAIHVQSGRVICHAGVVPSDGNAAASLPANRHDTIVAPSASGMRLTANAPGPAVVLVARVTRRVDPRRNSGSESRPAADPFPCYFRLAPITALSSPGDSDAPSRPPPMGRRTAVSRAL